MQNLRIVRENPNQFYGYQENHKHHEYTDHNSDSLLYQRNPAGAFLVPAPRAKPPTMVLFFR